MNAVDANTHAFSVEPRAPGMPKRKFPRAEAMAAARELTKHLRECCEPGRFIIAGSLRRRKERIGDVEVVYVPKFIPGKPNDLFRRPDPANVVDCRLEWLLDSASGPLLAKRLNAEGREAWGPKNKYAVHLASGIPVDLFATTECAWWNYLVCRTGSADCNTLIAASAQRKGWKWHPYAAGFTAANGDLVPARSEREVFALAGLDYIEPWER